MTTGAAAIGASLGLSVWTLFATATVFGGQVSQPHLKDGSCILVCRETILREEVAGPCTPSSAPLSLQHTYQYLCHSQLVFIAQFPRPAVILLCPSGIAHNFTNYPTPVEGYAGIGAELNRRIEIGEG